MSENQLSITDMQNITSNVTKEFTREKIEAIYALRDAQIHNGYAKMAQCATIRLLSEIKERKLFKDLEFKDADGNWRTCANWEEFCPAFTGQARRTIDEQIDHLKVLGEELYELNEKFKFINRNAFRDYKLIDASERQTVIDIVSKPEKTPDEVIEAFEQLMEKNAIAKQKLEQANAELTAKLEDTKEDLEAARKVSASKQEAIDDLNHQLEKTRKKLADADPEKVGEELHATLNAAQTGVRSALTQIQPVLAQLIEHGQANGVDHAPTMVGCLNQIIRDCEFLRETYGLPREAPTDAIPAWLKDEN